MELQEMMLEVNENELEKIEGGVFGIDDILVGLAVAAVVVGVTYLVNSLTHKPDPNIANSSIEDRSAVC